MGQGQNSTEHESRTSTVLVVDDEVLVRMVIADYLRDCGYHAIEAADAGEAIKVLSSETRVDILFTDIEMPGAMNGFGLAHWARENRPSLHILLTSGNPSKVEEAAALCLGEHFVSKPASFDDLHNRIARLLAGLSGS